MAIIIRSIENDVERDACYQLRMAVFVEEQDVPPWEEMDAYDETAHHFAAIDDVTGRVVGTARLVDKGDGIGKIGRVAVHKDYRGQGIGRDLMWYVMGAGFRQFPTLALDAQVSVIPFYERLGFTAEGEVFLDAGIEHRLMTCAR
jgi:predicted GNAT family N-acyltransferase